VRLIAVPIGDGYTKTEIARTLGCSPKLITELLEDARAEIELRSR